MSVLNDQIGTTGGELFDPIIRPFDQDDKPGVCVGIALAGVPIYRRGAGLANMELPLALNAAMRMRIGSVTKHFTCFALLLLYEEGLANPHDPIGKWVTDLHPVTARATLRQLMGHISGIRDACDYSLRFNGTVRKVRYQDVVERYRRIDDSNFEPGTSWRYNNGAYMLLSSAIEAIANASLDQVFRDRIFEPLEMHDTGLRAFDTDFLPNSATPHMVAGEGAFEKSYFNLDFAGAGGLMSTVDDLLRWLANIRKPTVGSVHSWSEMLTPLRLTNGFDTGYALGLMLGSHGGLETISHPGGWMGGNAQMLRVPEADLDIVVISNRQDVSSAELAQKILDAALPIEPEGPDRRLPPVSGTFRSSKTGRIVSVAPGTGSLDVTIDAFTLPFRLNEAGRLGPSSSWTFLKREIDLPDEDDPGSIRLSDFGNEDVLERVAPEAAQDVEDSTFVNALLGVTARLTIAGNGPRLSIAGWLDRINYSLEPLARNIWRAQSESASVMGGTVTLDEDCRRLDFISYANRSVPFAKLEPSHDSNG